MHKERILQDNFIFTSMEIKKITIITLVIIGLVAIVAVALIFQIFKKEPAVISPDVSESSTIIPSLPIQTSVQYISIGDSNDVNKIKKSFSEFVKEPVKPDIVYTGVKIIKFTDTEGGLISLSRISSSIGINIPVMLADLVEDKDYDIFYCSSDGGRKDYGLILYARSMTNRSLGDEDYKKIAGQMKQWEDSMLRDLHPLLFPSLSFSKEELNQKLFFQDGKTRYAEVRMPDGTKGSINYKQLGDPLIITSSLDCLDKGIGYFFDTEE